MTAKPLTSERMREIAALCGSGNVHSANAAIPELLAEVARLQGVVSRLANNERDLAETNLVLEQQDRDIARLTETARAASENWMGACKQRDEARAEANHLDAWEDVHIQALANAHARIAALETGLREACNWIADRSSDESLLVDRLRALADGLQSQGAT